MSSTGMNLVQLKLVSALPARRLFDVTKNEHEEFSGGIGGNPSEQKDRAVK
jgi:hypothetical protein